MQVERVEFTAGRGNLIVKYAGQTDKTMAFVGSHLDVVRTHVIHIYCIDVY